MNSTRTISLRAEDIRGFRSLEGHLSHGSMERFKSLLEKGCLPLHLATQNPEIRSISVHLSSGDKRFLGLNQQIRSRAMGIVKAENEKLEKLEKEEVKGGWIDGEKLAVTDLAVHTGRLSFSASIFNFSHILAMKDLSFEEIAGLSAFKLDTNTHVLAKDGGHTVLLVGQRGRKPGEPRMGAEALCAPAGSKIQWTLATNGILDLDVLESARDRPEEAWIANSFKEFEEELGVSKTGSLRYLGTMVDPHMFIGALGIIGVIDTGLSPDQIQQAKKRARHGIEVPVLDTIPLEQDAIAAYLRVNRGNMVPQLICGLTVLGFVSWGEDFLRKAAG